MNATPVPTHALSKETALRVVQGFVANGVHSIQLKNDWVQSTLSPALRQLTRHKAIATTKLIADASYVMGDICDFLDAPATAVFWYRRTIRLDPEADGAWRELGNMHMRLGRLPLAAKCVRRAIALADTKLNRSDLEDIVSQRSVTPESVPDRKRRGVRELLARGQIGKAACFLRTASPTLSDALLAARVAGALHDYRRYCQAWHRISSSKSELVTSAADWYYCPWSLERMPEALECILRTIPRWNLELSVLPDGMQPKTIARDIKRMLRNPARL